MKIDDSARENGKNEETAVVLLLSVFVFLLVMSYRLFDGDLMAPPTVVILGLIFGALCTFYNQKRWGLELSIDTIHVLLAGVIAFMIGGFLAFVLFNFRRLGRARFDHLWYPAEAITIDWTRTIIVIIIQIITIACLFYSLRRVTGGGSLSSIIGVYRGAKNNIAEMQNMKLPTFVKQSVSFSMYLALFYAYVVGNNIAAKAKVGIIDWIPILLSTLMSFMQGYRSDMLRYWVALIVVMYIITKRASGWRNGRDTKKVIRRILFSVVLIALVFVGVREVVGRTSTKDPLYYLTFYAGCPIAALDSFVRHPLSPSPIWGKETFYTLIQNIGIIFRKSDLRYVFFHEFTRSPNGTPVGNVYTAFRSPYYDFGFWGMVLVMVLMGMFFTLFYMYVRKKHGKGQIDIALMLYSYVAYTFFMYFYNCYNHFISISIIKAFILFAVYKYILIDLKVKHLSKSMKTIATRNSI